MGRYYSRLRHSDSWPRDAEGGTARYDGPMADADHVSSAGKLPARVAAHRERIAKGERPLYHATSTPSGEGADITIVELPSSTSSWQVPTMHSTWRAF